MLVLDLTSPYTAPVFDPVRAVVYYGNSYSVRHTLVDGRPVVLDRRVAGSDMVAVRARTEAACRRLWQLAVEQGALPEGTRYDIPAVEYSS